MEKPTVTLSVTLLGGATTEAIFTYATDEEALRSFGRIAGYKGQGIMPLVVPICPEYLQHLVGKEGGLK